MKNLSILFITLFLVSCEEADEKNTKDEMEVPEISGNKTEEEINGYFGVKNISHSKLMGSVYGNLTRLRLELYSDGENLDECGCSACNNNFQFDFRELYFNPNSRSIKYKKEGDLTYQFFTIPSDRTCVRYTED